MGLNSLMTFSSSPPNTHGRNGVNGGLENTSMLNPYPHGGRDGNHVRVGPQPHVGDVEIPLESTLTPLVERVNIVEINSELATQANGGNCENGGLDINSEEAPKPMLEMVEIVEIIS